MLPLSPVHCLSDFSPICGGGGGDGLVLESEGPIRTKKAGSPCEPPAVRVIPVSITLISASVSLRGDKSFVGRGNNANRWTTVLPAKSIDPEPKSSLNGLIRAWSRKMPNRAKGACRMANSGMDMAIPIISR